MNFVGFRLSAALALILLACFVAWQLLGRPQPSPARTLATPQMMSGDLLSPILPLLPVQGLDPGRVALGERLFHDARLSADLSVACANCHNLAAGGVDGQRFSVGIGGALGNINAPTILNSAYNVAQFWNGRAATLEEQAAGPIQNPIEMGATWSQVLSRLGQDEKLVAEFRRLYGDGLTADNLLDAIATFERSLVTVNSPFDRYLRGDRQALTRLEEQGYRRFAEYGCVSCHQGMLLGGNMFQKFGVLGDYFAGRSVSEADLGRYAITGREEDRHVFKVPSLRNVARTAPYFHDGSAATLEQAVLIMARYQLGRELSADDVEAIVAFLGTLDGELPGSNQR
ncbi:MAG: cytochrome B6 [Betaproteobacteria bacterium HGW-Betaproteobacteria-7]|jgi:cytochrome c peroxidase|nr:MAG: cytochrome B6 [Betaproteobacteria bacterium HGW-Betaproteobacteria-7]